MLNEATFKPKKRYALLNFFRFLSLVAVILLTGYSVLAPSDAQDVSEVYQNPEDVRSSRAYSSTKEALLYIKNAEKENGKSIHSIKSIAWIILEEMGKDSKYFSITYATDTEEKTAYIYITRENTYYNKNKTTVEGINKKEYDEAKSAWLLIFDKTESAYACEQSYSSYAISIIIKDMWG